MEHSYVAVYTYVFTYETIGILLFYNAHAMDGIKNSIDGEYTSL